MRSAKDQSERNREIYHALPPAQVGICRVRHDKETERIRGGGNWAYLSRFYDAKTHHPRGLPETVRYNGGSSHVKMSRDWAELAIRLNTPKALEYLQHPQSGIRNYGDLWTWEQLTFGGAFVVVKKIAGGRAYIESCDNSHSPDEYKALDYCKQLFSVAYSDDTIGGPDCGDAYTFIINNPGETLWMDVRDLTYIRPVAALASIDAVMEMAA